MKDILKIGLILILGIFGLGVVIIPSPKAQAQVVGTSGTVVNVTLTSANTEYSYALPMKVSSFTVKSRTSADFKLAFTSGTSGTTYFTIPSGSAYYENIVSNYGTTLYVQSTNAGQIIEIIYWK